MRPRSAIEPGPPKPAWLAFKPRRASAAHDAEQAETRRSETGSLLEQINHLRHDIDRSDISSPTPDVTLVPYPCDMPLAEGEDALQKIGYAQLRRESAAKSMLESSSSSLSAPMLPARNPLRPRAPPLSDVDEITPCEPAGGQRHIETQTMLTARDIDLL